jgi:tripartite-type tricarboxylate transporter receptor subunit TctC
VLKLNSDVTRILTSPAMKEQLAAQGLDPIPTSPEAFAKQLRLEIEKWGKVVKATGAKPQ